MKGRITAYAGYQLRDYLAGRAIVTVLATAAAAWAYATTRGLTLSAFDSAGGIGARNQLQQAFEFTLAVFAVLAAALAAQGLVARHRSRGYDRVLFSHPVTPARYYVQGFILAGAGAVVLAVAGAQTYAVAAHPVSLPGVAGYVALAWLTIGALAFLLSTLTPFHTPILAVILVADLVLDRYATSLRVTGGGNAAIDALQHVLPPGHVVVALRGAFARGVVVEPGPLVWPIAFGLACLILAVYLLSGRPFRS